MKAHKGLTRRRRWCLRLGVLAWAVLPGCMTDRHNCQDIPAGAIPVLTGTHTRDLFLKEAELAEADDFVIYEAEWLYDPITGCGTVKPGPYGAYHLGQMIKRLPEVPFPVLIQVNVDEKLNEARRQALVTILQSNGILDADTRVLVGFPQAEGLYGDPAAAIFREGYLNRQQINPNLQGGLYGGGLGGVGALGSYGALGGLSGLGGFGGVGSIGALGGLGGSIGAIGGIRPY